MNIITKVIVTNSLKEMESMMEEKLQQGWERVGYPKQKGNKYQQLIIKGVK